MTVPVRNNFFDTEPPEPTPEKKGLTSKQKIAIAMVGIALAAGVVGGRIVSALSPTNQVAAVGAIGTLAKQNVPAETQSFVGKYGDRYDDPVSVYYSEKAYDANHKSLIMSDDYISKYEILDHPVGLASPLGFVMCKLPLATKVDINTAVAMFNQYAVVELNLYMNALAKNPTPEGEAIVDSEFANFCSLTGPGNAFPEDDAYIANLMDTAKTVVSKYGSAANYSVTPASTQDSNSTQTYFDPNSSTDVFSVDGYGRTTTEIERNANPLVIDVEVYNGEKVSHTKEVLKDFHLMFTRQPVIGPPDNKFNYTFISIGQILPQ